MSIHGKILAATLLLGAPFSSAFAQEDDGRSVKYKERTEIDFEGVDVTGELVKPAGALLMDTKRSQFNPLIRLRENFNAEMKQSVDEVK